MTDRKPILIRCPQCQPGPYWIGATIVARTCAKCLGFLMLANRPKGHCV